MRTAALLAGTVCFVSVSTSSQAQEADTTAGEGSSPVQFSGSTHLYGQSSSRRGLDQYLPPSFVRWDVNSMLTLYGVPISISALVSSEQNSAVQNVNYFSVGLNRDDLEQEIRTKINERIERLEELKAKAEQEGVEAVRDSLERAHPGHGSDVDQISDLGRLRELEGMKGSDLAGKMDELRSMGLTSAVQGVTSLFPTFTLGTAFPVYSPLTLSGTPVTGLSLEFTPGPLYFAFTGGTMLDAIPAFGTRIDSLTKTAFSRTLTAARFGVGDKDATHLYLTGLYARDNQGSLPGDSASAGLRPRANYVMGTEGELFLFSDRLDLNGEVALAVLTGDEGSPGVTLPGVPSWLQHLTSPNVSSSYDYAYQFQGTYHLPESGTKVSAMVRRVGPGYTSLGVPYLEKDVLRYEGRAEQQLWNRQVSLSAYYRRQQDDLAESKASQTVTSALGAQVGLSFRGYPYLRVSYAPLSQQSQAVSDSLKIRNDITVLSVLTGYTFQSETGLVSSTNLSFIYQDGKTLSGEGAYASRNAMLNQAFAFAFPLTVSASAGYSRTLIETTGSNVVTFDFSAGYLFFGSWQNTLGFSLSRDAVRKNSVSLTSSLPLGRIVTASLGVESTTYRDLVTSTSNYHEIVVHLMLSKNW